MNASQSPYQALHQTFIVPVQRLLDRKRSYQESLQAKHFALTDPEQIKRSEAWIKAVGQELETIQNLLSTTEEMIQMISEMNEHIARAGQIIHEAQHSYTALLKNHLEALDTIRSLQVTEDLFMSLYLQSIKQNAS